VAWHQDLPHWNLVPAEAVTAWVALTDSNEANGCVRAIAGSHDVGSRASEAERDPTSLLTAGLKFDVSEKEAQRSAPMVLKAGQFSLHHDRLGIAFVHIPAHARQASAPDRHVVLVRGRDRAGFFPPDPPPAGDAADQLSAACAYFARLRSGEIPYNVR
jgi:non-heme Fe2+,alpha-ketoglutarate-dependent halogenase